MTNLAKELGVKLNSNAMAVLFWQKPEEIKAAVDGRSVLKREVKVQ
jgi:hypothetical protein